MSTAGPLLSGKRALVTGGTRGLGRAICRAFASEGANVAFTYIRHGDGVQAALQEIQSAGQEGRSYQVSVLDRETTETMVKELVAEWEGIDILVNNAGVTQNMPLALIDEEDFDRVMDINVKGVFLTSKVVLREMMRQKAGVILNIGSLAGVRMLPAPVHYSASKAAVRGLTEAMAKEVARYGVRVNCLAPGILDEGVGMNVPNHRLEEYLQNCSLRRLGSTEEVAQFAAFLVSDLNTYMTGETVLMDGGV